MKKIICFLFGHKWKVTPRCLDKTLALCHLHWLAGAKANCERCASVWNDLPNDFDKRIGWTQVTTTSNIKE